MKSAVVVLLSSWLFLILLNYTFFALLIPIPQGKDLGPRMGTNGERMYALLKAKECVDMYFVVGPNKDIIPAHQLVLVGASEVFATKFSHSVKKIDIKVKQEVYDCEITLPLNTTKGVGAFVKGIYLDKLDPMCLETLKEVLRLSHGLRVNQLLKLCEAKISRCITADNCLSLMDMEGLTEISQRLWNEAWTCFKRILPNLLNEEGPLPQGRACSTWSVATWERVLQCEGPEIKNVKEQTLFQQLVKWRDTNPSLLKDNALKDLVHMVRFPMMDLNFIVNEVLPTNILTDKEATDLLCHRYGGTDKNKRKLDFICKERRSRRGSKRQKCEHDSSASSSVVIYSGMRLRSNRCD